jgi:hypothetical protein
MDALRVFVLTGGRAPALPAGAREAVAATRIAS